VDVTTEPNIKVDLVGAWREDEDRIHLARDWGPWRALVNTVNSGGHLVHEDVQAFVWALACNLLNIVTCRGVRVTKKTGSSSDDWIYWHFGYSLS
jgi:hypothetical protein